MSPRRQLHRVLQPLATDRAWNERAGGGGLAAPLLDRERREFEDAAPGTRHRTLLSTAAAPALVADMPPAAAATAVSMLSPFLAALLMRHAD